MCGLLFVKDLRVPLERFDIAVDSMSHRGPDARGVSVQDFSGHRLLLGHRRLKILDLDPRSDQPFTTPDGRHSIVFNGEIYNYRELAERHSVALRTTSDTELLLLLYLKLGAKLLAELNGMFAFVITDNATGSYFAARDRLGIKPLYVFRRGESVIFSSEVRPILELTGAAHIDPFGVRQYRKLRTFFNGRTFYSHIRMFPSGAFERDGKLERYWQLPETRQTPPEDEELRHLLRSAVAYRCISDVPVGSYLSGGLDSTIVAALAEKPDTWAVGTTGSNEFRYARLAADQIGSSHHEVLFDEAEFLDVCRMLVRERMEPLSVPNEVPLYFMTRQVKKRNTVVLSGEGADEAFFGYDRIFRWAAAAEYFDLQEFDRLYSYGSNSDTEVLEDALAPFQHLTRPLAIVAAFFQIAHLHGLLRRLDNSTMRCGVEARVPFVDHRIVERLAGTGIGYRMQDGIVKAPLKRVFADLVPPAIINREKVGFPVDLASIFGMPPQAAMDRWLEFNLECLGAQ